MKMPFSQGIVYPPMAHPRAGNPFYSSHGSTFSSLFPAIHLPQANFGCDPTLNSNGEPDFKVEEAEQSKKRLKQRKYSSRYPLPEKPRQKRAVIQDMVRPLKQWLLRHRHNPYPTKGEKMELALGSNLSLVQVSNWFANARRRLKNVVQDSKCSWSKRLRMYNQFVQGNAELLSISSDDSIWNSDSEEDEDQEAQENHLGQSQRLNEPPEAEIDVEKLSPRSGTETFHEDNLNVNTYKKTMLQRYLSDSEAVARDIHLRESPVLSSSRKRKLEVESGDSVAKKLALGPNPVLHPRPILPRIPPPYPSSAFRPPPRVPQILPEMALHGSHLLPSGVANCCPKYLPVLPNGYLHYPFFWNCPTLLSSHLNASKPM